MAIRILSDCNPRYLFKQVFTLPRIVGFRLLSPSERLFLEQLRTA